MGGEVVCRHAHLALAAMGEPLTPGEMDIFHAGYGGVQKHTGRGGGRIVGDCVRAGRAKPGAVGTLAAYLAGCLRSS